MLLWASPKGHCAGRFQSDAEVNSKSERLMCPRNIASLQLVLRKWAIALRYLSQVFINLYVKCVNHFCEDNNMYVVRHTYSAFCKHGLLLRAREPAETRCRPGGCQNLRAASKNRFWIFKNKREHARNIWLRMKIVLFDYVNCECSYEREKCLVFIPKKCDF